MKRKAKAKKTRIEWEYCECGCHGHALRLGPAYYWLFNDLGRGPDKRKPFHLNTGHYALHGQDLGSFALFDEADKVARKHARKVLKEHRAELERAEAGL